MSVIEATVDVEVPLRAAYDQWTQFEDFPEFMEGVEEVRQMDDTQLHWVARIAGVRREWDARITEQIPDQLVAWTSTDGTRNDGLVTFEALSAQRTQVTLRLDLEPDGVLETVGDALGVIETRARGDLDRFKAFIEDHVLPTGAWRGEVDAGDVVQPLDGAPTPVDRPGEVAASTGGDVDLDRVVGTIPVVLVFVEPVVAPEVDDLVAGLGRHLVDFGRERVQLLAVARVDEHMAAAVAEQTPGNVRILADHDGALAERYGVTYRPGAPTTVLIDEDGQVAQRFVDRAGPALAEDLVARLGQLSVL